VFEMTRVLTINEYLSDNLGDQAIAVALESVLSRLGATVVRVSYAGRKRRSNPGSSDSGCGAPRLVEVRRLVKRAATSLPVFMKLYWFAKNFNRIDSETREKFDFAVVGGGQLILSNESFAIAAFTWAFVLKRKNIPYHFVGVGVGERFGFLDRILLSYAISSSSTVAVRDAGSQEKLRQLFGIEANLVPDVAYCHHMPTVDAFARGDQCVVGIVHYSVYRQYCKELGQEVISEDDYMLQWLERIRRLPYKKILLLSTTYADAMQAGRFHNVLEREAFPRDVLCVHDLVSLEEYVGHLRRSKAVLSGRMHSLILGEVCGCKPITWVVSNKLKQYLTESATRADVSHLAMEVELHIQNIMSNSGVVADPLAKAAKQRPGC
jgi:polysaccharide pyruvyl transferase WcaK-like protein